MEMTAGPSDKYEITPEQAEVESLIYETFNTDIVNRRQPPHAVDYVHARWVEYAYQWGDPTVFEFLENGKAPYPELITYHHLADVTPEEKQAFFEAANTGQSGKELKDV
jgi:hypothetical protein